jgi:hypothetical protein
VRLMRVVSEINCLLLGKEERLLRQEQEAGRCIKRPAVNIPADKFTLITSFLSQRERWMESKCVNIQDPPTTMNPKPSCFPSAVPATE